MGMALLDELFLRPPGRPARPALFRLTDCFVYGVMACAMLNDGNRKAVGAVLVIFWVVGWPGGIGWGQG